MPPSDRPRHAVQSLPGVWPYYQRWSTLRWFLLLLVPPLAAAGYAVWVSGNLISAGLFLLGAANAAVLFKGFCSGYSSSNWGLYFRKTEPISYWLGMGVWVFTYVFLCLMPFIANPPDRVEVRAEEQFTVDGRVRSYRLVIPHKREQPAPLVIALHGIGDTPEAMAHYSQLDRLAGKHGFVLVYPAARGSMWRTEADLNEPNQNTDVRFFDALLARLEQEEAVDSRRVYVLGMSNGATFAHLLAAARPEKIAALVVHSGVRPRELEPTPPALPILFIAGDHDAEYSGVRANAHDYFAHGGKGELLTVAGLGHTWSANHNEQMWQFLSPLTARPSR